MSIDYLEVKLDDCFAEGQAYVALSRARTLAGLRVLAFNPACCRTNPKVWPRSRFDSEFCSTHRPEPRDGVLRGERFHSCE